MKACHNCMHWPVCNMREDDNACGYYKPQEKMRVKPMTNADRIRAMSDEQLGRFLATVENRRSAAGGGAIWIGAAHAIDWLKQPAEEESG